MLEKHSEMKNRQKAKIQRDLQRKKWPIFALQDYGMFRNSSFQAYKF